MMNDLRNTFKNDLIHLFGDRLYEVLFYGSTVTGDYIQGRGDIDFVVFLNSKLSDDESEAVYKLHRRYRQSEGLERYLEGIYYGLDDDEMVTSGVYIGSSERGWKTIKKRHHSIIDHGIISQDHIVMFGNLDVQKFFSFSWTDINSSIRMETEKTLTQLNDIDDIEFEIHCIHSGARSMYTIDKRTFTTKSHAIEYVLSLEAFCAYEAMLTVLKGIRYPTTEAEILQLDRRQLSYLIILMGQQILAKG